MSRRIIPCQVTDEYVRGDRVVVGAAGSHNDVALRLAFGPMWEGTTRSIVWKDALGGNPTVTILGTDLLETGKTDVYIVPIPAEPKAYAGEMTMTIKGAVVDGEKETSATMTARAIFTVMESDWDENASESGDINPTQAEQLQAQIDAIKPQIILAGEIAENEQDRITAEQSRVEAENLRVSAENLRDDAERLRAQAEQERVENETARNKAEASRTDAETERRNTESQRAAAEQERANAEAQRVDSETDRKDADTKRAEEEQIRVTSENARVSAEELRQSAEAARSVWEDYNDAKAYEPGNKVYWQGSSYVCLKTCTSVSPANAGCWQLVARSGFAEQGFGFDVVDGRLICYYIGNDPPPFHIGEDGHLYAELRDGNATDLGKVANIDAEVSDAEAARDKAKEYADAAAESAAVYDTVVADVTQLKQENAKKIENIETVVVNENTLYVKGNIRLGSLQPNGAVDNSTNCYTQKNKIPVTPGEKILIVPTRPSGVLSAKLRLVTYQTEPLTGETGTIKIYNVIIPVDGYEYTIPAGCAYILYGVYCYTDASGSTDYNNILNAFSDTDIVCRFEYLDRKKELAFADDLAELDTKIAEKADKSIADALSVEKTESGNGTFIFSPMPNTKIVATQSGTFTGRNLKNIYSAFGVSLPTIDNAIASRYFWGTDMSSVNELLNQLPVGMYTLSVGFLLDQQNSGYDGSTAQKAYLYVTFDGGSPVRGVEQDITNKNTGDIVRASVSFEITQQTVGKITHAYMYCPNTGSATTTKWKPRIAYAQIESGDLSEYSSYTEKSGNEIEAYDSKMSFSASGDYTLTYRKISVGTQDDEEELPAYFQTEVDDCVAKLENYCTDKSLVYIIVTDTHVHNDTSGKTTKSRWKDTIKNMKAVHKGYQVDSVIHLGDMVNGSLPREQTKSIIRMIRDDLRSIIEPNFILVGNHDTNTFYGSAMDEPITEAAMYGLWERYNEKDITSRPSHLPYWYKDYDSFGIRVIYLSASMGDGTHGGQGANWGYPESELTWLSNVALDTNYQVLFFSHMPFTPGFISDASTLPQNGDRVIEIVTEFQTGGGVVIGLVNGHTHFDYSFSNGHFREISLGSETMTSNTADKQGSEIASYVPASAVRYGRTDDTLTQDLWNILVVKPDVRQCKIIRFGAGVDFTWNY